MTGAIGPVLFLADMLLHRSCQADFRRFVRSIKSVVGNGDFCRSCRRCRPDIRDEITDCKICFMSDG